jgi:hypothetical protein
MKLVGRKQFGAMFSPPVSRQAIDDAIKRGALDVIEQDGKKYIDSDSYKSVQYLRRDNSQRKGTKKPVQPPNVGETVDSDTRNPARIEFPSDKKSDRKKDKPLDTDDPAEKYNAARAEKTEQEVIKLRQFNAFKRGDLIDREKVYNSVFLFWDRVLSNLERLATTYLDDVAGKIITAKELTPEIRQYWVDGVLEQIDDAKTETVKKIEDIKKEQEK